MVSFLSWNTWITVSYMAMVAIAGLAMQDAKTSVAMVFLPEYCSLVNVKATGNYNPYHAH